MEVCRPQPRQSHEDGPLYTTARWYWGVEKTRRLCHELCGYTQPNSISRPSIPPLRPDRTCRRLGLPRSADQVVERIGVVAGEGRVLLPVFRKRRRPRSENASTIASSRHWQGGAGLAWACHIHAMLLPSGRSQMAGVPEVCSSTRSRVGWRSETSRTPSRQACRIRRCHCRVSPEHHSRLHHARRQPGAHPRRCGVVRRPSQRNRNTRSQSVCPGNVANYPGRV